jgi:hypothetical protein
VPGGTPAARGCTVRICRATDGPVRRRVFTESAGHAASGLPMGSPGARASSAESGQAVQDQGRGDGDVPRLPCSDHGDLDRFVEQVQGLGRDARGLVARTRIVRPRAAGRSLSRTAPSMSSTPTTVVLGVRCRSSHVVASPRTQCTHPGWRSVLPRSRACGIQGSRGTARQAPAASQVRRRVPSALGDRAAAGPLVRSGWVRPLRVQPRPHVSPVGRRPIL